jgi:hydrogenase nickel incorporation protein HypA/HybF
VHELSLAQDALGVCVMRLRHAPGGRIARVRLAVGELSAVEPELLRYAWEAVTAGGPHAGAVLEVDWRPARQTCDGCGAGPDRPAGSWQLDCPRCGHPLRVEGGQELEVVELGFEPGAAEGTGSP